MNIFTFIGIGIMYLGVIVVAYPQDIREPHKIWPYITSGLLMLTGMITMVISVI